MHSLSEFDWKDRATFHQFAAQGIGIGDVAVMGNRGSAHGKLAKERLHVADDRGFAAGGGIAHMADGERAGQGFHQRLLGEIVAHIAEAAGGVEAVVWVVGDDAARLLPAMLQGVQAEGHEIRRIGHADDAEDAALLSQFVVVEGVCGGHLIGQGAAPCRQRIWCVTLHRPKRRECHDSMTGLQGLGAGDAGSCLWGHDGRSKPRQYDARRHQKTGQDADRRDVPHRQAERAEMIEQEGRHDLTED